ncbi:MAG: hypothetical protein HDR89_06145 [Bacteroides sp.]|nr:hypothetical protein [Bacteroides sp.]
MGNFWAFFRALFGINILTGNSIFDGNKGRIGCGRVTQFGVVFFPL